jgi:hypothetical protein
MFGRSEPDFANGGSWGALVFCDAAQHVLCAQHFCVHALSLPLFETMHEAIETCIGALKSATARITGMQILLNITSFLAQSGPCVERRPPGQCFFSCESHRQMARRKFHRHRILDFPVGENAMKKLFAEPLRLKLHESN